MQNMRFEGKVVIVTGASSGIGRSTARLFAMEGAKVVAAARRLKRLEDLRDKVAAENAPGVILPVKTDVRDPAQIDAMFDTCLKEFGHLDILVNNAGVAPKTRTDLLEMTEESYDRVLGVNTKGSMFFTQLIAKHMIGLSMEGRVKRGTIVNVSSCSADVVSLNRGEYCVSKAGVSMLTKLYAARLAPEGILVHEVRPGVIATDMTTTVQEKYDRLIAQGAFPIARWGTAEDVANAVSLLCSDQLAYTTGNYLDVDGGFHIRAL